MNLDTLSRQNPLANPFWTGLARGLTNVAFTLPRQTRVELEGEENLPREPAIFAPNHSHKYDFLPLRYLLLKRDENLVTWIKARAFKDPIMAKILGRTGNIPLSSTGYLIAADFEALTGRRPSEEEYRLLRDHIDRGPALPEGDVFDEIQLRSRDMLGFAFDAAEMTYRQALRTLYFESMQATLALAGRCVEAGHHMHFYPQGAVSSRLTPGKVGIIEAALALDLPIIPVGISGCREVFIGQGLRSRGGTIAIRIGEALRIDAAEYGPDFRPFHPDDEDDFRTQLQADTDRVMEGINELVSPEYRWAEDGVDDGKVGIARFY